MVSMIENEVDDPSPCAGALIEVGSLTREGELRVSMRMPWWAVIVDVTNLRYVGDD